MGQTETPSSGWFKLQELNFASNNLTDIADDVFLLAGLKKLDLSSNGLSVLSSEVELLYDLTELNLANNRLTSVPDTLSNMALEKVLNATHHYTVAYKMLSDQSFKQ